jgi:hypothetical protein
VGMNVVVIIMVITKTLNPLAGYRNRLRTQDTRKITSPSAVQFVQGYRLEYTRPLIRVLRFCAGTGLVVVSSATGPTECVKYYGVGVKSESVKGRDSNM